MSNSNYVELRNGPTVPEAVILLALELEAAGFRLTNHKDKLVVHRPGQVQLSDPQREAIAKWKLHLMAVNDYVAPDLI